MAEYRWNKSEFAEGYDAAAEHIHPHYIELQDAVLDRLATPSNSQLRLVDAGGGSGRLVERVLRRFANSCAVIIDQSTAFLALAERRLKRYGSRAICQMARLQDDWASELPFAPTAIVSMSAIHHLDSREKAELYRRCHRALVAGGVLINADEVRPADDADYLQRCRGWAAHSRRAIEEGLIPPAIHPALQQWAVRNIDRFGEPRQSGDDCHETADAQLRYLTEAGFTGVECPWAKEMWAILIAQKGEST